LQHFLDSKATRILGCAMNSCPYYLIATPAIRRLGDLRGKSLACREGPSRNTPIAETFRERAQLRVGEDLLLQLLNSDHEAFNLLMSGRVEAALLPRPFGFWAEERGFTRITDWPDVVDDPLPITIETTATLLRERGRDFSIFLAAHREGIRYMKAHRAETIRLLEERFGHSPSFAAKTFDEYLTWMDERLTVDSNQLKKLLGQVAPESAGGSRTVASDWMAPGALRN
jgi:ABC-type amino acid transport substrate-binding protein